ncbi:Tyrosine phosphatase-like protein J1 [Toxocara canis]|uniref:Tyrosine phosphatase-like protein J1 n=1 Tax=Toxocara canis TaxID=6265 RepID=A0A0B2URI3_TOXCA|nr:Tyrosine phosphatase-like protein J1 [Toxocara canis]
MKLPTVRNSADKIGSGKAAGIATSNDQGLKWAQACCHSGLRPLLKEFASLRKFLPAGITAEVFNKNGNKNRYTDVLCLDDTRVILKGRSKDSDYIHANWVVLPSTRKYICTQGPLEETVEDFWLMVFKVAFLCFTGTVL